MRGWSEWLGQALLWLVGACLPCAAAAQVPAKGPAFGPAPAWVQAQAVPLDAVAPAEGLSQGRHYLLADQQVRVAGTTLTDYRHTATRAVHESGVEDIANVQIRFDPSYQTLTVHRIAVRRGGQVVSSVAPGAMKLLQREASLESLIYDGRLTAHVALQDVRVGDVVEMAYSMQGHNPVFGAHRFGSFDFDWGVPVAYRHARLLWPAGRPLHWKLHNGVQPAQVTEAGGELDHRWQLRNVPARLVDADSPAWYDPYAWAEWGEFPDWAAVARWALPLYRLPDAAQPGVDREVARIAASSADPEQRLLAALRFVQREVRYLGIEMGVNSHEPHRPEQVLQRRYGDCKDKTLLSLALLRGLGIPARAALVHTRLRQTAADRLPSPWAFNHVLVQADVGGRRVWLDPTRRPQAGKGIAQWVQADFGRALLVDADTRELVPMAGVDTQVLKRDLHAVVDATAGFGQPATLTITTRARGESAEQLREALATTARDELQKQYLDYYTTSYPGLSVDQPMTVGDDTDANVLELVERYRIASYGSRDDKRSRWNAELEVPDLLEWLRSPKGMNRQAPLALRHPVDFTLVSEFRLPGSWDLKPDSLAVDDAAFTLRRQETWKASTLTLTDHYVSRADHVPAGELGRYAAQLDKARTGINYNLYRSDDGVEPAEVAGGDSPHWLPACVGLLALIGLVALAARLHRWDPEPAALRPEESPETAVGGWLWLVLLGLAASLCFAGKGIVEAAPAFTVQAWQALTTAGSASYNPWWAPTLLLELVCNLGVGIGALLLIWLMLKRRSGTPRLYVAWWAFVVAANLAEAALFQFVPALSKDWTTKDAVELARTCAVAALWISYMRRSERVRRTFVRRLHNPAAADPQSPLITPA